MLCYSVSDNSDVYKYISKNNKNATYGVWVIFGNLPLVSIAASLKTCRLQRELKKLDIKGTLSSFSLTHGRSFLRKRRSFIPEKGLFAVGSGFKRMPPARPSPAARRLSFLASVKCLSFLPPLPSPFSPSFFSSGRCLRPVEHSSDKR